MAPANATQRLKTDKCKIDPFMKNKVYVQQLEEVVELEHFSGHHHCNEVNVAAQQPKHVGGHHHGNETPSLRMCSDSAGVAT